MFESLSSSLQSVFKNLRGYGKLTEKNIKDALREVRLALLEADVHYQVAKDFVAAVKERSLGADVLESVTPGQQIVKCVHEELVRLLGSTRVEFDFSARPAGVLLLGLHGAGKTTTAGKLARRWKNEGSKVLLVACDIRRPAAVDQLAVLAGEAGVDLVKPEPGESVPAIGRRALDVARREGHDRLIYDSGGRFQIDAELVGELKALREETNPANTVLVLDAAIGQESVDVAETFNREVGLTGLMLTKLDGDARGGAALSVRQVTGCPILLAGTGEHQDDLDVFYPDRMASRILGMGDVVSFVEKAQEAVDEKAAQRLEEKLKSDALNLEDFLDQMQQMKRLGPIENLLEMLPGNAKVPGLDQGKMAAFSEKEMVKAEAIIQSMTVEERRYPERINGSRRQRIARGSGTTVSEVNQLLKRFDDAKRMTRKLKKMEKKFAKMRPRLG